MWTGAPGPRNNVALYRHCSQDLVKLTCLIWLFDLQSTGRTVHIRPNLLIRDWTSHAYPSTARRDVPRRLRIHHQKCFVHQCCAIHRTGVLRHEILEAHANGERFRQYLHGLQEELLMRHIADPIIVMDNFAIHHMEMVMLGLDHLFASLQSLL